jgi:adenine-specific DNA-methyltransferase
MPKKPKATAIPKLDLSSPNPAEETVENLRQLVPGAFDEDGKLDWQKLRQLLGGRVSEEKERYSLSWAGKREAIQAVQRPGTGALVPIAGRVGRLGHDRKRDCRG